jgi:glycine oxidase
MLSQGQDVIVIGGGVIGLAVAYFAARAGLQVTVIEAAKIGGQGSSVAAGLIAPASQITGDTPFARLALASLALVPELRDQLLEETGIDIQLDQRGSLRVSTTKEDAQEQQDLLPEKRRLGLNLHWLSAHESKNFEPTLAEKIYGAVYGPDEAQLSTARLLAAYRRGAERRNVLFVKAKVTDLMREGNKVTGVMMRDGCISAHHVVDAGGAWASELVRTLGIELPIQPPRGQTVVLRRVPMPLHHIIFWRDSYLTPRAAKEVVVGAANDYPGFVSYPTASGVATLLADAISAVPTLSQSRFGNVLAGLRPRTPDKLPILGSIPGWKGISIAAGHNSNGLGSQGKLLYLNSLRHKAQSTLRPTELTAFSR